MRTFGQIEGIFERTLFHDRRELHDKNVHRPLQAGISGSADEGADSIVISGGYEDDEDYGDEIIYTGEGGQDPISHAHIADQRLTGRNAALATSRLTGFPVRVIRSIFGGSARNKSAYRYRYDGLFQVVDYWQEVGRSGFRVWRFKLVKLDKIAFPDSDVIPNSTLGESSREPTARKEYYITRVVRDTEISKSVKQLYHYECQICRHSIETESGLYAEAAHIKGLGRPHNGPDSVENILCLCPNHHTMFDYGRIAIAEDLTILGLQSTRLYTHKDHHIGKEYVNYHREHYFWHR